MHFLRAIDISDIADIAIVSVLLYAGLIWFKKTRAFLVVIGIVILGAVYALARYFSLFLTTAILQGFFAVLLIAIIVIFQEELRRFFERVALWGLGRQRREEATPLVEALVRTAADLARARTGALIVIAGRDPVGRHIEGGTELGGRASEALLKSIFDRSSPGHDGAVIIDGGRVARFAAYLPLSKDLTKLAGLGTRHAAALGLAERCDALALVVSEERGQVSAARDGEISKIHDLEMLGPLVGGYLKEKFPPPQGRRLGGFFRRNLREKAIAIVLAAGLWVSFAFRTGVVQRDFFVSLEYANLPAGLAIDRAQPRGLTVTLSGKERTFRFVNPGDMKATVDLAGAGEGHLSIPAKEEYIGRVPRNLKIYSVRPDEIDLTLKKVEAR